MSTYSNRILGASLVVLFPLITFACGGSIKGSHLLIYVTFFVFTILSVLTYKKYYLLQKDIVSTKQALTYAQLVLNILTFFVVFIVVVRIPSVMVGTFCIPTDQELYMEGVLTWIPIPALIFVVGLQIMIFFLYKNMSSIQKSKILRLYNFLLLILILVTILLFGFLILDIMPGSSLFRDPLVIPSIGNNPGHF